MNVPKRKALALHICRDSFNIIIYKFELKGETFQLLIAVIVNVYKEIDDFIGIAFHESDIPVL
jgi:hypothetical protein